MRGLQLGWVAVAALAGCGDRAAPPASAPAAPNVAPAPDPPAPREPFDETKGYLHKPSGVGFVYPDGWENTGARSDGPITSLGLNRANPKLTVSLYWTDPGEPLDAARAGQNEYDTLVGLYGPKVGKPQAIQVRGKDGFKLTIDGGPLGFPESSASGVVYVFAVPGGGQSWKIKLRATVTGRENLAVVEQLLQNYRW